MKENNSGKIGNIIEVNSESVIIEVSKELTNYNIIHEGFLYRIGQVGSFVKIKNGLTCIYGIVESFSSFMQTGDATIDKKIINVSLLGYKNNSGEFERGPKITPSIDDKAYILDQEDIRTIFKTDVKYPVKLGYNFFSEKLPVFINLNEFILKHSFIVGSTGSGKSNTVAYLLSNIVKDYPSSRALIIDIHGEYMNYLTDNAKEFSVFSAANNFVIPYWMLDFETLCKIFGLPSSNVISTATDIFRDRILQMKKKYVEKSDLKKKININDIDINSPIPFSIKEIWYEFYCRGYGTFKDVDRMPPKYAYIEKDGVELKGDAETLEKPQFKMYTTDRTPPYKSNETYFRNIADNILNIINNDDYKFMFGEHEFIKTANTDKMISNWIENDKQITILNLSGIPYHIVDIVIGIISNLIFDVIYHSLKIKKEYEGRPLLICFEEAHKYLKSNIQTSYSQQAVERIMKEGRKFGVGAMIISQRPVEIPNTIVSQVSTFIALRLTNSEDQSRITSFAPNNFSTFLKSFPALGNGDAFVIGESMKIPMKIKIPLLESVCKVKFGEKIKIWTENRKEKCSYIDTIEQWILK
jgi:hypothetical protein